MEISSGKQLCPKVQADKMTLTRPGGKRGNLTPEVKPGLESSLVLGWRGGKEEGCFIFLFLLFLIVFLFFSGVSSWAGCNMKKGVLKAGE